MARILDDETFEEYRFYDETSRLNQIIGQKIRWVFEKLFQNTDVNLDDFYFTAVDDDKPNAFVINKANTKTGKYIVAVSYGLIDAVSRTEEFAAIIAHECGHVIWAELIGGKNSILQERSADVHSVDMMMNAGWNPRYVTVAQKKIFSNYSKNDEVSFDVHGDDYHRIDDVKSYMTKIASERGDFPPITNDAPDSVWVKFQRDVEKFHSEDGYDTFLEKQLKKKFGSKDLSKLNRLDVLNFFLEYINSDSMVSNKTRSADLRNKLMQYDYSTKSDAEIKVLQDIFLALFEKEKLANFHIESLENILSRFKLDRFGPFQEQYENIENFIKYYDDEKQAIFYAKKIRALLWTVHYRKSLNNFEYPFFQPLKEQNVGKMLPWHKLLSYKNEDINEIFNTLCDTRTPYGDYYSFVQHYIEKDYFCDDNRIVLAYGEEAHRLYEERDRQEMQKMLDARIQKDTATVRKMINQFESMIKYINGETDCKEYANKIDSYGYDTLVKMLFDTHRGILVHQDFEDKVNKYKLDYSAYFGLLNEIKNTNFYKQFIANAPELALYPDLTESSIKDYKYVLYRIVFLLNPANFKKFDSFVMKSLLKLCDDMTALGHNDARVAANVYETLVHLHPDFVWEKFDSQFLQSEEDPNLNMLIAKRLSAREDIRKYNNDLKPEIIAHSASNYVVSTNLPTFLTPVIETEFQSNHPSKLIEDMMKSIGVSPMPTDASGLMFALKYIDSLEKEDYQSNYRLRAMGRQASEHINGGDPFSDELRTYLRYIARNSANNLTQLMYYLWAEYMRRGYKFNPIQMILYFENRKNENISNEVCDIFGKYITLDTFKSLSMMEKIELFEFMDMRNLFSEKVANKNAFIKIITDEVLQYPDTEYVAREIVLKILTRRCVTQYGKPLSKNDFEFADERERFIEFYAKYWAKKLGRDDGSDAYLERVKKFTDFVTSTNKVPRDWGDPEDVRVFSQMVAEKLLDSVSNKVLAQERAAKMFGDAAKMRVNADKVNSYDYYGRTAEAAFGILAKTPKRALATIQFLNEKISDESVQRLIDVCSENANEAQSRNFTSVINKQSLTIIHENFWNGDLPIRAYVMNRLLGAYTQDENKKLQLVVDTYFKKDSEYYSDAIIVLESVYKNLQDYERGLILSALLASGQNEDNKNISNGQQVGRGLKMFFQAKGGAFVKFGQLLSYLPTLDSDIRKELASLREKANIPTRDELFEMLKQSLPESEYKKISYVGKILGGGSIYVSVAVKYDGKDCVIALMRPHTRELMHDGIEMISNSVNDMAARDKKFAPLKNIVTQAKLSCESEIDIKQDYEKYTRAVKTYESFKVHTPTGDYSPDVARWMNYGADENGDNAFKIMEMAPGESLISGEMTEEEKHDMAMAYVALELSILLSGARWDTDRHAGQQNFYNKSFQDFCIGIFDTGAQMNDDPNRRDKIMLGHLLYELIRGVRGGKKIADVLNTKIKTLDSAGKTFGFDTLYIDGVQRGLIALSDIIEYQKEIKDKDGNIIQERRTLSESDLQNIIVAVLDSGVIDKTVKRTLTAKAILNKLRVLRPGWFKTLNEGINPMSSEISVEYTGDTPQLSRVGLLVKARQEIEKLLQKKRDEEHLGINKDLITKSDDNAGFLQFGELRRA